MFDLALLVTHLETNTGYVTTFDKGQEPTSRNLTDPPTIMVGNHSVEVGETIGENDSVLPYVVYAEHLTQVFYTQFSCNATDTHIVWRKIHNSVAGWTPLDIEKDFSGVVPVKGLQKGITNGRIWWIDYWRIEFPHIMAEW